MEAVDSAQPLRNDATRVTVSGIAISLAKPDDPPESFPDVDDALAEPEGLLAAGGDLSSRAPSSRLSPGIFPWYDDGQPILWWSPDPRCVLRPESFHVPDAYADRLIAVELSPSTAHSTTSFEPVLQTAHRTGEPG